MLVACRRIALMALASFALLVIAELVARAAEPGPFRWYDISPYEKVTNLPHVHRRNARVQWDGSSYEVDSHGWRGPEFTPDYAKALIEARRGTRYTDPQADAAIASLDGPNDRARMADWIGRFLAHETAR